MQTDQQRLALSSAAIGLAECRRIERERAASPAWNARPDASMERSRLAQAIDALDTASRITYFEMWVDGNPDEQDKPARI